MSMDPTRHRHGGDAESAAAWRNRVKPDLTERRAAVLAEIETAGPHGMTCDELAAAWGVGCNEVSARLTELKFFGHIEIAGKRLTRHGNTAKAYRITERGVTALARFSTHTHTQHA